jgi:hypothetical protein
MILARIALFFGLLSGLLATQVPEFVEQYRQRLGGAIDELTAVVSRFDQDSASEGLSRQDALTRMRANTDRLVQRDATAKQETIDRLARLRQAQEAFRHEGPVARLGTFVTAFDARLAAGTWHDFEPAVPTSAEGLGLGLLGFIVGGGAVHVASHPLRRKRGKHLRTAKQIA